MDLSRKYLKLICSKCGKEYLQQERIYRKALWRDRCPKCRKIEYFCEKCGTQVTRGYTKCKKCAHKPPDNFCFDCEVKIARKSFRCQSCNNKNQDKGLSKERTKFTNSVKWQKIRIKCFERDNFTCQKCGRKQTKNRALEAHHIKSYAKFPELRLKLENLETLCRFCHAGIHWGIRWEGIVVHHSASGDISATEIDRIHKRRGWRGIGYHIVIRKDGSVEVGRPSNEMGAHVRGYNDKFLGIVLTGNFEKQPPSKEQYFTLSIGLKVLMHSFQIPRGKIYLHKNLASTLCPGRLFNLDKVN